MSERNFWYRFTDWIIKWRLPVIAAFGVAFVAFGAEVGANITNVDNSLKMWFEEGDPDYAFYNEFKDEFESDEMIMVTVEAPPTEESVFTERMMRLEEQVVEAFEGVPDVEEVQSLLTMNHVRGESGILKIEPVIDMDAPLTPQALAAAKERALGEEMFVGFLVSKDARVINAAGRIISTEDKSLKERIGKDVKAVMKPIQEANPDVTFHFSGPPLFDAEFDKMAQRDGEKFLPLTLGLVALVLFVLFRRPVIAVLPVILMFAVITFTWGAYFWLGNTMNMAFNMSGSILVAACIADAVHIIGHYYGSVEPGKDRAEAIRHTVKEMVRPCFYTSITTAAGFFSFATSEVRPIQQLGVYSAVGVLVAFGATITLIPAMLSFLPMPSQEKAHRYRTGLVSRTLDRLADWSVNKTSLVLAASGGLLVVSIVGLARVRVEGNSMAYIPRDHWIREAVEFFRTRLGGLASFEVIFTGEPGLAKDPQLLARVDRMQKGILEDSDISNSFSHVNYLKDMNQVLHDGDAAWRKVPTTKEEVAQYLLLAENSGDDDMARFMNYDYSMARLTSRSPAMLSKEYLSMMDRVNDLAAKETPSGVEARVTGLIPLYAKFDRLILRSQIRSLGLAFGIVFLFMCILTRSVKIGFLSMIPNVLPIFLTLAIMGYLDVNLDAATVMIAGIALGIAVDDTIHYINRFRVELDRSGWNYEEALHRSTHIVGRPIFFTSVILLAGFGVLIFGNFRPTQMFGFLTGLTMIFALVGDLILLPAVLLKLRPWGAGPAAAVPENESAAARTPLAAEGGAS